MKHYVFLSIITGSGGVQCYVASKAKYLESIGWHVVVISGNYPNDKTRCKIEYLNKFLSNGTPETWLLPYRLPHRFVEKVVTHLVSLVGTINNGDETIVESWDVSSSLWGELLASRIKGRHIFWAANETYRGKDVPYDEKIGFYMYKMDRGEIFSSISAANRLFAGYKEYKQGDFKESIITEDPVQDVECDELSSISSCDWTICYIGRSNKPYVPNIYLGINEFAKKHPNKSIQFVIVGDVGEQRKVLTKIDANNLKIIELGDLYPLPRSLFSLVDVVIAGSGSARHSADEGALVITADVETQRSHGLLGYDTNESIYGIENKANGSLDISFCEALERALVRQIWRNQPNKWVKSPGIDICTNDQFAIIKEANDKLEYYDEKLLLSGRVSPISSILYLRAQLKKAFCRL